MALREASIPPFVPYPSIERHAVVGDRRTAAMVATDGTVDWLCLPDYDGPAIFAALLDAERGGFWRLGLPRPTLGEQRYEADGSAVLTTRWQSSGWMLELTDAMAWPDDNRAEGDANRRVLLRRLRCVQGACAAECRFYPRHQFSACGAPTATADGLTISAGEHTLSLWTSSPMSIDGFGARASFSLSEDQEFWAGFTLDEHPSQWSGHAAEDALAATRASWKAWNDRFSYTGPRGTRVRKAATMVRLLAYAPTGALVAAPTTSLPERIGGDRNYDYRLAWVRDASLSLAILSLLGDTAAATAYMDWLAALDSSTDSPLQVVYRVDGRIDVTQRELTDLGGYQGSTPVRIGNHAFDQRQLDSLGYLADCALIYLDRGGAWSDSYWDLVRRAANYTGANWHAPDSGIWELPVEQHYVSIR